METRQEVVSAGEERLRDANSSVYLGAGAGEVRAKSPLTRSPANLGARAEPKTLPFVECSPQSFTIKPNALPQWESRTPPARILENGFIRASVRRAFCSAHHNIGTINKTRELEVYSRCEAMLGLLGRPNATNAGMNIRLTFILDDGLKAVSMVNPEARKGLFI